jgi:TolA-binding protein
LAHFITSPGANAQTRELELATNRGLRKGPTSMTSLLCAVALTLLLLLPACSLDQNRASQNPNSSAIETARQDKRAYEQKIDSALRDLDQEIQGLKIKSRVQNRADRKQLDEQIAALERKRDEARIRLMKLKDSSDEAWRDMKAGIDKALNDLDVAYEQAASHFR